VTGPSREASDWPSIGIVVPVYNEGATLEHGLVRTAGVASRYRGRAVVIAVDDGSVDESPAVLDRLEGEIEGLVAVRHSANVGYGQALKSGARKAAELDLEYVVFIDSDLTNPPEDVLRMAELARLGHSYVKASRFVPGGSMAAVSASRRLLSRSANLVAAALYGEGVRDVTNGFRMVRTDLFLGWPLSERGFAVIVEEFDLAVRSGVRAAELSTTLTARTGEQRPTAFSYSPATLWSYLRYPLRTRLRKLRTRRAPRGGGSHAGE
jgi:glycosyltransferase involved in cell wall biosynthesis